MYLNKVIKSLTLIASLCVSTAYAADIPIYNQSFNDGTHDAFGGSDYEIQKMDVNWASNGQITVDVFTNFGTENNEHKGGDRYITFGDLLIGTNAGANYAFSLGDLTTTVQDDDRYYNNKVAGYERYYDFKDNEKYTNTNGSLYQITDTIKSDEYHSSGVQHGDVFGNTSTGTNVGSGSWSIDNSGTWDKLSFSFNVAGISAFQNASQLNISWAMSCYNDAVDGVVNILKKKPAAVPEPSTILLMLLGLVFIINTRKNKSKLNNFSA